MLLLAICLAGLLPGLATVWMLRGHGWPIVVAAGIGVTLSLPATLIATMVLVPPLGVAVAAASCLAALHAYDQGRVWIATVWAVTASIALTCSGVSL
jgi:hypothetical protein